MVLVEQVVTALMAEVEAEDSTPMAVLVAVEKVETEVYTGVVAVRQALIIRQLPVVQDAEVEVPIF